MVENQDFDFPGISIFESLFKVFYRTKPIEITAMTFIGEESQSGIRAILVESLSQLLPREFRMTSETQMQEFSKTILYDHRIYIENYTWGGDSPLLPGYLVWKFGIWISLFVGALIGVIMRFGSRWLLSERSPQLFVLATVLCSTTIIGIESPQDALNSLIIRSILLLGIMFIIGTVILS